MQQVTYGFMDAKGYFLRVSQVEHDPDNAGDGYEYHFEADADYPIYETDDPAAIIDTMIGRQNFRYLSEAGLYGGLPSQYRIDIADYTPVAFVRSMSPVIEGGDLLPAFLSVRYLRFGDTSDPKSTWLANIDNQGDLAPSAF